MPNLGLDRRFNFDSAMGVLNALFDHRMVLSGILDERGAPQEHIVALESVFHTRFSSLG